MLRTHARWCCWRRPPPRIAERPHGASCAPGVDFTMGETMSLATVLDPALIRCYEEQGYTVVPGLFRRKETDSLRGHFDAMRQSRLAAGTLRVGDEITDPEDPLAVYPRIMQPHRHDAVSRGWLLDARLRRWLNALAGRGGRRQVGLAHSHSLSLGPCLTGGSVPSSFHVFAPWQ